MNYLSVKRAIDLLFSGLLLLIALPLFALVALLIIIEDGLPVFYVQERLGKGGSVFKVYKFRTMTVDPDRSHKEIRPDNPEVTWVGKWLRRFKIDETPQLWNVFKGDVSLIGPRPALPSDLEGYTPFQKRRLEIRGGLTGLAQVKGNTYLTWPERIIYDIEYVDTVSPGLDIVILAKTVLVVLLGEERFLRKPETPRDEGE